MSDSPACYLHPDRPALLRCSRCEQPICGSDAIEAPVGYQCPECATGGVPVRRLRDLQVDFTVTKALVATIAVVYLATQAIDFPIVRTFGLIPVAVGDGNWWMVITSGFLHANLMHIAFNGILLWRLGELLEPRVGHHAFGALYAFGLAGGSLGVMLLAWITVATPLPNIPVLGFALATSPVSVTVGASGAVFALMGAAMSAMRSRGINPWRTDIGTLVLLNLVLTFLIPGISVGGHVGGFVAGLLGGRLLATKKTALLAGMAIATFAMTITLGAPVLTSVLRLMQ
ncbi:MAG: rhomboid family intramembrane serine protease [Nitriliruptoraceae bacterium]